MALVKMMLQFAHFVVGAFVELPKDMEMGCREEEEEELRMMRGRKDWYIFGLSAYSTHALKE